MKPIETFASDVGAHPLSRRRLLTMLGAAAAAAQVAAISGGPTGPSPAAATEPGPPSYSAIVGLL